MQRECTPHAKRDAVTGGAVVEVEVEVRIGV
jgi:hypothetical protein